MNALFAHSRRSLLTAAIAGGIWALLPMAPVQAADMLRPDALIQKLSDEVIGKIKTDPAYQEAGFDKISQLVDKTVMPHVNFERMTALAVGRGWRKASPMQRTELVEQFRVLLLRTYSGAVSQVRDHTVKTKRLRAAADDTEVIVRSKIVGGGEPIQLNYRLEKAADGWKIYDLNVLGVWLVETYRNQFKQIVNNRGIDGLLKALTDKNRQFAKAAAKRG